MGWDVLVVFVLALVVFEGLGYFIFKERHKKKLNAAEVPMSPVSNKNQIHKR